MMDLRLYFDLYDGIIERVVDISNIQPEVTYMKSSNEIVGDNLITYIPINSTVTPLAVGINFLSGTIVSTMTAPNPAGGKTYVSGVFVNYGHLPSMLVTEIDRIIDSIASACGGKIDLTPVVSAVYYDPDIIARISNRLSKISGEEKCDPRTGYVNSVLQKWVGIYGSTNYGKFIYDNTLMDIGGDRAVCTESTDDAAAPKETERYNDYDKDVVVVFGQLEGVKIRIPNLKGKFITDKHGRDTATSNIEDILDGINVYHSRGDNVVIATISSDQLREGRINEDGELVITLSKALSYLLKDNK